MSYTKEKPKYKLKYNRAKPRSYPDIKTGVTVETDRGIGIVTHRDNKIAWVALPSEELNCEQWKFDLQDIKVTAEVSNNLLKEAAYTWIMYYAQTENVNYEQDRSEFYVVNIPSMEDVKTKIRKFSVGRVSAKYLRLTHEKFDFEIDIDFPSIGTADRLQYAYDISKGNNDIHYIRSVRSVGKHRVMGVFNKEMTLDDINYGQAYSWTGKD